MSLLKGREIDRFLASPDASVSATLIFGPEVGLVSERVDTLLQVYQKQGKEVVRITSDAYRAEGMHVESLLKTDSLFSPSQVFLLEDSADLARHIKETDESAFEETAHRLVISGGDLKKTSPLRQHFEKAAQLRTIICYQEGVGDLAAFVADKLSEAKLAISRENQTYLVSLLSDNRLVNRGEMEKLTLYCHGKAEVSREDIDAVLGDVGLARLEEVIDLAMTGERAKISPELVRFSSFGIAEEMVFAVLSRHLDMVFSAKLAQMDGASLDDALRKGFGFVHFSRKTMIERQVQNWQLERLESAISGLSELEKSLRLEPNLKEAHLERFFLRLSSLAGQERRRSA